MVIIMTFSDKNYVLFQQLCRCRQSVLKNTMYGYLQRQYGEKQVVDCVDFLYAAGDIDVLLVAHMDTVFRQLPEDFYWDKEMDVIWSPGGMGADDRAGIMAIIEIIRSGRRPHILLTTNEEIGGLGAEAFSRILPPITLKYVIEIDRQGKDEAVFYECNNKEFMDYVLSFGFVKEEGIYTDIVEFCQKWDIAGVNVSAGYFYEHTATEMLCPTFLYETIDKVIAMLDAAADAPYFDFQPTLKARRFDNQAKKAFGIDVHTCDFCQNDFFDFELIPYLKLDKSTSFVCGDCAANYINYCKECQSAYEVFTDDSELCPICGGYYVN